jgi:hypothetical protein
MAKDNKNCLLNKGLTKADFCGYSLKQITDIYLANFSEVGTELTTPTGEAIDEDGYTVKAITGSTKWYHIEPAKDSSSYNDDLVIGGNGSKYRTHTMTFSFNSAYDSEIAFALDMLSLGRFVAVLRLSDGTGIMLGRLTGLEASSASSLSEAAADGQNGITVTLECNTVEPALPLLETALKTVVDSDKPSTGA